MIKNLTDAIKNILGPKSDKVECAIDETVVDCADLEAPIKECGPGHFTQGYGFFGYTETVPAPAVLPDDEWFGPSPVKSEKQLDYMEQETAMKKEEEKRRQEAGEESENIHQLMYEMATKGGKTTTQLDPIGGSENFQGGSENVHR